MTYLIVIGCIALYMGYFFYVKQKNAQRAAVVNQTVLKNESFSILYLIGCIG